MWTGWNDHYNQTRSLPSLTNERSIYSNNLRKSYRRCEGAYANCYWQRNIGKFHKEGEVYICQAVSTSDCESWGPGFESYFKWNSAHGCMVLFWSELFIIIPLLFPYDWNNSEKDVKHQIIIIINNIVFQYENTPIQIYWKFHHQKLKVFR